MFSLFSVLAACVKLAISRFSVQFSYGNGNGNTGNGNTVMVMISYDVIQVICN